MMVDDNNGRSSSQPRGGESGRGSNTKQSSSRTRGGNDRRKDDGSIDRTGGNNGPIKVPQPVGILKKRNKGESVASREPPSVEPPPPSSNNNHRRSLGSNVMMSSPGRQQNLVNNDPDGSNRHGSMPNMCHHGPHPAEMEQPRQSTGGQNVVGMLPPGHQHSPEMMMRGDSGGGIPPTGIVGGGGPRGGGGGGSPMMGQRHRDGSAQR
mmetsp:Transcript_11324/g.17236  ORF Transcript_11324/g.17236 Transcript_11324/m.17236 type:complete len:208 (-) Transcript_11324:110-733(-)